jgi:hypothetical protein
VGAFDVVVLLARLVVEDGAVLQRLLGVGLADLAPPGEARARRRHLQRVEGPARVAEGGAAQRLACLGGEGQAAPEPLRRRQRPVDEPPHLLLGERPQGHHPAAREERRDDLEARVLGGGPDEGHRSCLDVRQQGVLLPLVEAVDLVDEEDGALAVEPPPLPRRLDDLPDLLHPPEDGAEGYEDRASPPGHDACQRRLAGAGRPPKEEGGDLVRLDGAAEHAPGPEHVLLTDEVLQPARPQPLGQGPSGRVLLGGVVEEVHGPRSSL